MTEEKIIIDELLHLNDELENYFRNTIIPQLYIDRNLVLQKYTPPAMKQFDISDSDLGKSIMEIHDNFRFPTIIRDIRQVMDSNEILEKEIQTTDFRWFEMNVIPYTERQTNRTNGVIITFVDITMRISDLKEREKLIADYETLLDTISHDIKNPLANLSMAIELFKNTSPENQKEFQSLLKIVDSSLSKMYKIIIELTDTMKEGSKYKAEEEVLNFKHILEEVRLILNTNISTTNAVIQSEINVSEITFSKRKLRSILYNLVNNALKFKSPERRQEIFIKTERENDFIVITVKDNGIGIDAGKFDAIFSKYYRVENAIEGSGIGLYLVKELVTNAGGKIILESQPGIGSEFKVFLKAE